MKPTRVFSLVLSAAALSACTFSPIVLTPVQGAGGQAPGGQAPGGAGLISNASALTTVRGAVSAPRAYGPLGGDPFAEGGGLIAAGGQNLIAAGGLNYRLQQGDEEAVPLAGSEVYLADGQGNPLPGIRPAITNARGEFEFQGVPEGFTYLVVARARNKAGKPVQFKTLVRGKDGRGDIDPATTLAAEAITEGAGKDLGQLDPERFRQVRDVIRKDLARGGTPDLGDKAAVKARIGQLKEQYTELREAVDALRTDLRQAQAMIDQLRKELEARPTPAPSPVDDQRQLPCLEAFKLRDKNQDGVVDFDEAGRPERFKELDRNGDGRIQPEEVCAVPLPAGPDQDCDGLFRMADADGDGHLDVEQAARILPTVNKIAIDESGVQRLAPEEDPVVAAKRLDRNGDGRISREEFCGGPDVVIDPVPCEALFKRADLDGDGIVTYEESAKLDQSQTGDPNVRFLKERDRDGDAKLTLAEACGGQVTPPLNPCDEKFRNLAGTDGVITGDELSRLGWTREQFLQFDANRDGRVDRTEWGWAACGEPRPGTEDLCARRFYAAAGTDGVLTSDEVATFGWSKDVFIQRDRDGSGQVDLNEFCASVDVATPVPTASQTPTTQLNPCDEKFRKQAGTDEMINSDEAGLAGWADSFQNADKNYNKLVDRREFGWAFCGEPMPTASQTPTPTTLSPCDERFYTYAGTDRLIGGEEARALNWTREAFDKYDANKDGFVDRKEWGLVMCSERQPIQPVADSTVVDATF
jgi:Ca2+-binding EF-hand superfamily protein